MQRRKTIALTPEEQRRFLEESHTIILTSIDRRGYPHSVAMWYVADPDGTVVMTTFAKSQKAVNLRRDPRCGLLVESGRTYPELKGLLIRGRQRRRGNLSGAGARTRRRRASPARKPTAQGLQFCRAGFAGRGTACARSTERYTLASVPTRDKGLGSV